MNFSAPGSTPPLAVGPVIAPTIRGGFSIIKLIWKFKEANTKKQDELRQKLVQGDVGNLSSNQDQQLSTSSDRIGPDVVPMWLRDP